jgi:lipopolysaccharide/colanic/teichoic acid biosynthesis glycosyltransferase
VGVSALSLVVAISLRLGLAHVPTYLSTFATQALTLLVIYCSVLFVFEVSARRYQRDAVLRIVSYVGAHSLAWLLALAFVYFQGLDRPGRGIVALFGAINLMLFLAWSLAADRLARRVLRKPRTIVVGTGELLREVVDKLGTDRDSLWQPVAVLDVGTETAADEKILDCSVYRHVDELHLIAEKERADCLILVPPYKPDVKLYQEIARCRVNGMAVCDAVELYEETDGKVPLKLVTDFWALFLALSRVPPVNAVAKRLLDVLGSVVLLAVCAPLLGLTALLVRLIDGKPILFSQERLGREGKPFLIWKFRTMVRQAEAKTGPVMAQVDDPRVTSLGRVLRRSRLDELPQLFNVVRGDMSLVGPRPEREAFVSDFRRRVPTFRPGRRKEDPVGTFVYDGWREAIHVYSLRLLVRPGLTGWAQVKSGYGGSLESKREHFEYDLYYIKNQSLLLDIAILCRTPLALVSAKGR